MGDFWNDTGFYEQHEIRRAIKPTGRERLVTDAAPERDWIVESAWIDQDGEAWRRDTQPQEAIEENSTGPLNESVSSRINNFLSKPLLQISTLPALLTRQCIVVLPLALLTLYYLRSFSHWLAVAIVTLLLISASPFLISMLRIVFLIILVFAVLFVLVILTGSILHWWNFTTVDPTLPTKTLPSPVTR